MIRTTSAANYTSYLKHIIRRVITEVCLAAEEKSIFVIGDLVAHHHVDVITDGWYQLKLNVNSAASWPEC